MHAQLISMHLNSLTNPFPLFLTRSLMPGSIHISVAEWPDNPPHGPISTPYSIKVYVGKKEYQSLGKDSFSFPLTSIRDDLIIMLCDFEGNLVTKKEVKTISVAEKGDAEVVLPLEIGGNIKLILSFVLNEEAREKIREMRSSALKRKHKELLEGTNDIFSPGTSSQIATKDHSKLSTKMNPQMPFGSSRNKIKENAPLYITKEKEQISFPRLSRSVDDLTGNNNGKRIPNRSPSDNMRKMISAFERNAKQNLSSEISLRTRTRVNEDIEQRRVSQALRRSFSAGNLSEDILQNDPNFAQNNENLMSNEEVNMEDMELNLLQRSVIRHHSQHKILGGLKSKLIDGYIFHGISHCRDYGVSRYIDQLTRKDETNYFFGISDMLMPRYLCLTSAPKEVRNFLENIAVSSTHNEKIKFHGVASQEVNDESGTRSQTEDLHHQKLESSIFNGWLIDQGARIFILIVACGTIFVNTR